MKFSNPRLTATFAEWPSSKNGCVFTIESKPGKGVRCGRTTTGATKYSNYGQKMAIVDGDDGKTYILQYNFANFITVFRYDFKSEAAFFQHDAEYNEIMDLINQAA